MSAPAYQTLSAALGGLRGRLFYRLGAFSAEDASRLLHDALRNPEERKRLEILALGLRSAPTAVFTTYRALEAPDVIRASLRMEIDGRTVPVFACMVESLQRLEMDLEQRPFVIEGLDFQVAPTRFISDGSLRTALQTWCERAFPSQPVPRIALDPWSGDAGRPDNVMLELLLTERAYSRLDTKEFALPATDRRLEESAA